MAAKQSGGTSRSVGATHDGMAALLNGPRAKWLFFAIYFAVTVFLFRDFIFSNDMLFGSDTIPDGVYTRQYYKEYHEDFGGIPRWNPFILGGLPFVDAMHGDTFYPGAWLKFFMPLTRALGQKLVWHVFLAGALMYIFLRTLTLRRDASFLGGLMYMLAPSFVSLVYPGHDAKMYVIALLPLAFTFLERGMRSCRFVEFVLLGGVMGLLILTSHIQMAYYSYWAIGLYFVFRLLLSGGKPDRSSLVRTGLFVMAVVIAVGLGAVQMLPSYKFTTTQSVRSGEMRTGYEYATSWSMHPEEALGMAIPSFQGNSFMDGRQGQIFDNLYWGRNPFKLNSEYQGIIVLLLALLALVARRSRHTWFFLGLALLALVYALGATTPIYRIFYALVPGVKNFRAAGMIIFLFQFSVVAMAAMFLSALFDGDIHVDTKNLLWGIGGIIAAALVVTVLGKAFFSIWNGLFYRNISADRLNVMAQNIPVFVRDLWRVVLFAAIALAVIRLFAMRKLGVAALAGMLALLIVIDDAVVASRFIVTLDPLRTRALAADNSVSELRQKMDEEPPFRIMTSLIESYAHVANYYAMFGIQSVNGMHNNELKNYELFRGPMNRNFFQHWLGENSFNPELLPRNNFLKVANAKYILAPARDGGITIIPNTGALDRAFTVHSCTVVEDDSAAVDIMSDIMFNAANTVILHDSPELEMPRNVTLNASRVVSMEYDGNNPVLHAEFDEPGFVVLSMNWVPYWRAYIDDQPVPIHRAYITFMAVECPPGDHIIRFEYHSEPYEAGKKLTLASFVFVLLALVSSGGMEIMKRRRS